MSDAVPSPYLTTDRERQRAFERKYGAPAERGWSAAMRWRYGYYLPSDLYEALVEKIATAAMRWIDVGGGASPFTHNPALARELSRRVERFVAVDPSDNVLDNPFAAAKVQTAIERFVTDERFDLATCNMVVEHVDDPPAVVARLAALMEPGGLVVVHTVNLFSPIPIAARLSPFALTLRLMRLFGARESKHVFPVVYRMNTRGALRDVFASAGFVEAHFEAIEDLSTTVNFRQLHRVENAMRLALTRVGLRYPERNLLGVYRLERPAPLP